MAKVTYTVHFTSELARRHMVEVKIEIDKIQNTKDNKLHFKVPVWTPGSYKVREFSQHFEIVQSKVAGKEVKVERSDKNTWEMPAKDGETLELTYQVYAFEQSVRQSYIDEFYAFLHGVSAFGYVDEHMNDEIVLQISKLKEWKDVYVAAPAAEGKTDTYHFTNYDLLADSPIALGSFDATFYKSGGVPHTVVMIGKGNYDLLKVREDFKKISDEEVEIFGSHPSDQYIHFIYNVNNGGGGLEHLNCQTSMFDRFAYTDEAKYKKFLGLISHEYFHLWNVKRIAPKELGPFNYDTENYTDLLWVAEGFTSYFDDLVLLRSGIIDQKEYLSLVAAQINRYENTPGKEVMTLEQSSRLAWIKAYLPHENSNNTTISYYNKGMLAALAMDLTIREETRGEKSLDDLLKLLFQQFDPSDLQDKQKGYDLETILSLSKDELGVDLQELLHELVFSTEKIDYEAWFKAFGLSLTDKNDQKKKYIGVSGSFTDGRYTISRIDASSTAEIAGLSVKDEIIAVNGWRVDGDVNDMLQMHQVGDVLDLTVNRDGMLRQFKVELASDPEVQYSIEVVDEKNKLMKQWLCHD